MVQISLFFGTDFIIFGTGHKLIQNSLFLVQISFKFGTDFVIFGTQHKLVQISLFFAIRHSLVQNSIFLEQNSIFLVHKVKRFGTDFIIFVTPTNYDVIFSGQKSTTKINSNKIKLRPHNT